MTEARAKSMHDSTTGDEAQTDNQYWADILVRIAKQDDRKSFKTLYEYFAPRIKAYAINRGSNQHAEALVQEVMTNVWRNADKYSPNLSSVPTWIFTIMRNQHIDMLRKLNRTRAEIIIETEDLWQIPTEEDTTVLSIQKLSTEKFVKDAIEKLPEEQMIALRKVYYEGKTHEKVAEELNVPLGTIKGRLRLSLQKLHVMLEAKEL